MENDENSIDKALGIGPIVTTLENSDTIISGIVENALSDSAQKDFTLARSNIREVLENTAEAASKLAEIAEQSQNPRAYEVLSKLMDTMINASEKLMQLHQKIREVDKIDQPQTYNGKNVTNNLYVGSTAEIQKILASIKH